MLWNEDIPVVRATDDHGRTTTIDVIAGRIDAVEALDPTPDSWAATPSNSVGVYTVKMDPHAEWTLPKTSELANRSLFFYKGNTVEIEGQTIPSDYLIEAVASEDIRIQNGSEEAYLLILEGRPISEPVLQHGPFVMNTHEEIREAMMEYGKTQFGGWPWDETEVAHAKEKGRFALHSDGKQEIK